MVPQIRPKSAERLTYARFAEVSRSALLWLNLATPRQKVLKVPQQSLFRRLT